MTSTSGEGKLAQLYGLLKSGQISRREFIERAVALGVALPVLTFVVNSLDMKGASAAPVGSSKPALARPAVIEALTRNNVAAFVADYTAYGADITEEMKRLGRVAVPLVVYLPAHSAAAPTILPDPNPLLGPGHYADLVVAVLTAEAK